MCTHAAIAVGLQSIVVFFLRQRYLVLALYGIFDEFKSWGNLGPQLGRLPCLTAVFLHAVELVGHPLVAVHESRADSGDVGQVKTRCIAALGFFDNFVAHCVSSGSFFRAQLDGDICEWCLMLVAAVERSEGVVAVDIGEEEVSELFDLVFPEHHFRGARLAAAVAEIGRGSDWARLALWIRPVLRVFQAVDEVTDVIAAAEVGEDCGEAIHCDG